jgi:DNA polymerase I
MEYNGIKIDVPLLDKNIEKCELLVEFTEDELKSDSIYKSWEREYKLKTNLESTEQLGHVLYNVLEYPINYRTPSGAASVDEEALSEIDIPFVKNYLRWGHLQKLKVTYLEGIKWELDDRGYIHPFFNLQTAITYRSSSSEINFQNLPTRQQEMARLVRSVFIGEVDEHFGELDYKALEVCIGCGYHKDPLMMKYVTDSSTDMHRDTAMELFFLAVDQVVKGTTRDSAKNQFVFPEFYGSVYQNCAKNIWKAITHREMKTKDGVPIMEHLAKHGITERGECVFGTPPREGTFEWHLKNVEKSLWQKRFHGYANWKETNYQNYLRTGGLLTLTGFYLAGVFGKNDTSNYGIQGSAFHCNLWSMIRLHRWLKKYKMKTKLRGQIHDSQIFTSPESELQDVIAKAKQITAEELPEAWRWINVPLSIEVEVAPVGGNWFGKKKVA